MEFNVFNNLCKNVFCLSVFTLLANVSFAVEFEGRIHKEYRHFPLECKNGSMEACHKWGTAYIYGKIVDSDGTDDDKQAVRLFSKACEGGHPPACIDLGMMYSNGYGLDEDLLDKIRLEGGTFYSKAFDLLTEACDNGYPLGCSYLGHIHEYGSGVPKDLTKAMNLFIQGCDSGDGFGCYIAGDRFDRKKEFSNAVKFYRKGCDRSYGLACTYLGLKYQNGEGVEHDDIQALDLYEQACDLSDASGCSQVSHMKKKLGTTVQD